MERIFIHNRTHGRAHGLAEYAAQYFSETEIISVADDFYNFVIEGGYTPEKEINFMQIQLKKFSPGIEKAMLRILKI